MQNDCATTDTFSLYSWAYISRGRQISGNQSSQNQRIIYQYRSFEFFDHARIQTMLHAAKTVPWPMREPIAHDVTKRHLIRPPLFTYFKGMFTTACTAVLPSTSNEVEYIYWFPFKAIKWELESKSDGNGWALAQKAYPYGYCYFSQRWSRCTNHSCL